jgi:hypothetical protein
MALKKEKTLTNGVKIEYWKLTRFYSFINNGSEIFLGGFINKDVSDSGAEPVCVETFSFPIPKEKFINGNAMEYAYTKIKESRIQTGEEGNETENNWFADAEDC